MKSVECGEVTGRPTPFHLRITPTHSDVTTVVLVPTDTVSKYLSSAELYIPATSGSLNSR